MKENGYYAHISPDSITPAMRIQESGYDPLLWAAESMVRLPTIDNQETPDQMILNLFKSLFFKAFRADTYMMEQNIFAQKAVDVGARVINDEFVGIGGICWENYQIMVIDYAMSDSSAGPAFIGIVYEDLNGNNLYDVGEGVPGANVTITKETVADDDTVSKKVITNSAGGFTAYPEPGTYRVSTTYITGEEQFKRIEVTADDVANIWLQFQFEKEIVDDGNADLIGEGEEFFVEDTTDLNISLFWQNYELTKKNCNDKETV